MSIKQKTISLCFFLLFFIIIEILTFHALGLGFAPNYFMLDVAFVAVLGSIVFIIKSDKAVRIYLTSWIFLFTMLYITNTTMFRLFGDIFTLEKLFLVNEADQVFEFNFIEFQDIRRSVMLFISFIIVNRIMKRLFTVNEPSASYNRRIQISVFLGILIINILVFKVGTAHAAKNIYINGEKFTEEFYVTSLKKSAFSFYGMLSFYYKEAEVSLSAPNDEVDFGKIDSQETTKYHGLLEGKNVITIMIESGQEMAINRELTPNLYKLRKEGVYFSENYSVNKTNVSEHIGIVGSYPSTPYSVGKREYDLPFTVPHLLNDDYITTYFHDNNGDFYKRDTLMQQLGFEHYYLHDELFPEELPNWDGSWNWGGDYTLDSVAIERILPHMIHEDQLFYSFWTTLSTHGPYADTSRSNRDLFIENGYFDQIEEAEQNGDWVNRMQDDLQGEFQFKYYQAAMMDLDVAVGRVVEELENNDLLDDTIIILYSDHHAYYHDLHLRKHGLTSDESYKMDLLYDTNLYMWNPTLNAAVEKDFGTTTMHTFSSPYIVVPTLLDLLGESYDSDWYVSLSYFDEDYLPLFYSHQHNAVMNNVLYTVDCENIIYEAKEVDEQYREDFLRDSMKLLQRQSNISEMYVEKEE
ncbi:LTA synthase family protein [Haloplasma contractile]|uniref:Arylsulfatase protein n=1 Tax=Haloplasma contractile SSD-17B TaxID=1033810 RepID=F7PRP1_9MOLU|nr:sulfatase-like hydrolase/transferase [Haloplasma contractile]ERJ11879.1 Arylsulfatase protein [Haloplasma contractile SSD-17B]